MRNCSAAPALRTTARLDATCARAARECVPLCVPIHALELIASGEYGSLAECLQDMGRVAECKWVRDFA